MKKLPCPKFPERCEVAQKCYIGDPTANCAFLGKANREKCCMTEGFTDCPKPVKLKWACSIRK